jgi:hypothetical protein
MKKIFRLLVIPGVILLASCSSGKITSSWVAKDLAPKKYNKILVLCVTIDREERSVRQLMEQHLTGDLKDIGYNAVSSFDEYGPRGLFSLDEKAIAEKVKASGFDAVVTIVLLDKQKEKYYVPGRVQYTPYAAYYNHFGSYYNTVFDRVYTRGYYTEDTKYFWECNFYEVGNRNMIYSAQTESFNPASTETLAHNFGLLIVNNMVKHKVLLAIQTSSEE